MPWSPFGTPDPRKRAEKRLASLIAQKATAANLRITGSIMQAGVADGPNGALLEHRVREAIRDVIEALAEAERTAGTPVWNLYELEWTRGRRHVTLITRLDPDSIPREIGDPVFERAAAARLDFWSGLGEFEGYVERGRPPNAYGQTPLFLGPHERLAKVRRGGNLILATDGLSTPWPGVADRENGFGLELALALPDATGPAKDLLFTIVRQVIDYPDAAETALAEGGACILDHGNPPGLIILTRPEPDMPDQIPGLPFGPAGLLAAVFVSPENLAKFGMPGEGWDPTYACKLIEARRTGGLGLASDSIT